MTAFPCYINFKESVLKLTIVELKIIGHCKYNINMATVIKNHYKLIKVNVTVASHLYEVYIF